jgi:hypothetical protein
MGWGAIGPALASNIFYCNNIAILYCNKFISAVVDIAILGNIIADGNG